MPERADAVVVGCGLLGLATARELAQSGRTVIALDQAEPGHDESGSKGTCRIFRLGYDDPAYVELARHARAHWMELEAETGAKLLHPTAQLTFGPQMPAVAEAMRQAGALHEVIDASAARDLFPGVAATGQVLLEPDSAVIAADHALTALGQLVPDVRTGVRVRTIADDGRSILVSTDAGQFTAPRAIICAGAWTPGLLARMNPAAPVPATSPTQEQVEYFRPADSTEPLNMPIMVHYGGEFPYGLPVPGTDLYKFGLHHSGPAADPDNQEFTADLKLTARICAAARQFLPEHDPVPLITERCIYDTTPDEDFVIDRIGNVVIGSGTSGHGFKFGPLLGAVLADLAEGLEPAPWFPASRFRIDRRRIA